MDQNYVLTDPSKGEPHQIHGENKGGNTMWAKLFNG